MADPAKAVSVDTTTVAARRIASAQPAVAKAAESTAARGAACSASTEAAPKSAGAVAVKIFSDANAFVTLLALLYSIIVTLVSAWKWGINLREERRYKRDYAFYEMLVLPACKDFLKFAALAHKELERLLVNCMTSGKMKAGTRAHVIESSDVLYRANADLESDALLVVSGFSGELQATLAGCLEQYYDSVTKLFAEFDRKTVGIDFVSRQNAAYSEHTKQFVDDVFARIRAACPTEMNPRRNWFVEFWQKLLVRTR